MTTRKRSDGRLPMAVLLLLPLAACSGDGGTDPIRVASITLATAPRAIEVGASIRARAAVISRSRSVGRAHSARARHCWADCTASPYSWSQTP